MKRSLIYSQFVETSHSLRCLYTFLLLWWRNAVNCAKLTKLNAQKRNASQQTERGREREREKKLIYTYEILEQRSWWKSISCFIAECQKTFPFNTVVIHATNLNRHDANILIVCELRKREKKEKIAFCERAQRKHTHTHILIHTATIDIKRFSLNCGILEVTFSTKAPI